MDETKIDKLRKELIKLREERDKIIFEKGMAAEENKDLRENSTYDFWFDKEMLITNRIENLISIINENSRKKPLKKPLNKTKKPKEKVELDRPKWL